MTCSACGGDRLSFTIPPSLRSFAPSEAEAAALCRNCLRVTPLDSGVDAPADVDWDPLPAGEAGVATALLLSLLDSLALRRADVLALVDHAEAAGGDPLLALDRLVALAAADNIDPHVDLARRSAQLEALLE